MLFRSVRAQSSPSVKKSPLLFILKLLLKIIIVPVIVLLFFFEKVLMFFAAIASMIGWLIFGLCLIAAAVMFLSGERSWSIYAGFLIGAFVGFAIPYISVTVPALLIVAREFLTEYLLHG